MKTFSRELVFPKPCLGIRVYDLTHLVHLATPVLLRGIEKSLEEVMGDSVKGVEASYLSTTPSEDITRQGFPGFIDIIIVFPKALEDTLHTRYQLERAILVNFNITLTNTFNLGTKAKKVCPEDLILEKIEDLLSELRDLDTVLDIRNDGSIADTITCEIMNHLHITEEITVLDMLIQLRDTQYNTGILPFRALLELVEKDYFQDAIEEVIDALNDLQSEGEISFGVEFMDVINTGE